MLQPFLTGTHPLGSATQIHRDERRSVHTFMYESTVHTSTGSATIPVPLPQKPHSGDGLATNGTSSDTVCKGPCTTSCIDYATDSQLLPNRQTNKQQAEHKSYKLPNCCTRPEPESLTALGHGVMEETVALVPFSQKDACLDPIWSISSSPHDHEVSTAALNHA